ncbi:RINT1-like protein MAG2 isoform X1 [Daucus carota subsp. sativus]|uniref:RINT1-like protein MAG2 isoform X1 n=1 Tax=Daucus carota subsp. sativus TaxID=79200 RepID=UPI0007B29468|nr:PREDICTED: RINT1-like protein MAG2 isoform X1 [Daucus carota subsp. sativus]XP_017256012.1 PREDICTED: RINT1-like protein MAG2 isoform X1 [Daucus carota subsp. sativus]XP_017256021.1 PREDICTED: RINT1-like protein MAG2 isoform X1 [Daucus carota subsp. sativus]XP_017256029.1 PREDICTED: RINT1-like protein MAG2 isoform X1 [Daucus carota subsp. sativus]XP_017256035.1 PREDICTED: RINT1-like protein MAG2 isoform X1 [Daucus carota subsp. sativus]
MISEMILPPASSLSPSVISYLDTKLHTKHDQEASSSLLLELESECNDLDKTLSDLNRILESHLFSYASFSSQFATLLTSVSANLSDLHYSTALSAGDSTLSDGTGRSELPALAKEVARVEAVRVYAETALKFDTLVGDIEDAVSSVVNRNLRKHPSSRNLEKDVRLIAIKALKQAEDILAWLTEERPQWARLVLAVDHRVDRALATLRPQAIADHRSLLVSLGWPPSISSSSTIDTDKKNSAAISNPLFSMQGELKSQYCESFLALCSLQELQIQRKSRQLEGHNLEVALCQPLWTIEELVNSLFIASQRHFSKWVDKPEFIFALVYKITRDYVDTMDDLLQPLVDEAMLLGYSCREEWISAMVSSLSTYLAKEIFPVYVGQLEEDVVTGIQSQARISWLNLIDLMISFDKRVHSLIVQSGILVSLQEDGNMQKLTSLQVFCDRPDWLELWAEIELNEVLDKLKLEVEDERGWSMDVQGAAVLFGAEEYKSPAISGAFLDRLSSLIDRCWSIPRISLRSRFVRVAGAPVIHKFLDSVSLRCQEAEGLTALTDDAALIKVTRSVNAVRYLETVLKEWCEDVFFLEMGLKQAESSGISFAENSFNEGSMGDIGCGILGEEIRKLEEFRVEWIEMLSTVVLRGFDARCRDYIKNRKQWQERSEEGLVVSRLLVDALDYLQGKVSVLEGSLNKMDFVGVWRSLASGVDKLIFSGILFSNAKFYDGGTERFGNDLTVLFGVFGAWCLRPEGFFPKISEGLRLLKMEKNQLQGSLAGGEVWLKENGIRHLSVAEAEKIAKNRVYNG